MYNNDDFWLVMTGWNPTMYNHGDFDLSWLGGIVQCINMVTFDLLLQGGILQCITVVTFDLVGLESYMVTFDLARQGWNPTWWLMTWQGWNPTWSLLTCNCKVDSYKVTVLTFSVMHGWIWHCTLESQEQLMQTGLCVMFEGWFIHAVGGTKLFMHRLSPYGS